MVSYVVKTAGMQVRHQKTIFPLGSTFLASVFGTFLTRFSGYLEEITSPYLIKNVSRRGIEPGPPG